MYNPEELDLEKFAYEFTKSLFSKEGLKNALDRTNAEINTVKAMLKNTENDPAGRMSLQNRLMDLKAERAQYQMMLNECKFQTLSKLPELYSDFNSVFAKFLKSKIEWSVKTFGDGEKTEGLIDHITEELHEIRENPNDLSEWIDVILLAIDGYLRHGGTPERLFFDLWQKQKINETRKWGSPADSGKVNHIKDKDPDNS